MDGLKGRHAVFVALALVGSSLSFVLAGAAPAMAQCADMGWHYDISSSNVGGRFGQIGQTQSDYNGTNSQAKVTLSYADSGTISESFNVSVSAEMRAFIFAKVSAKIDAGIQHSRSLTFSNAITINVPAKTYGNGGYGWYKTIVWGHGYFINNLCHTSIDYNQVIYKAPTNSKGWCTWLSTTGAGQQRPTKCSG